MSVSTNDPLDRLRMQASSSIPDVRDHANAVLAAFAAQREYAKGLTKAALNLIATYDHDGSIAFDNAITALDAALAQNPNPAGEFATEPSQEDSGPVGLGPREGNAQGNSRIPKPGEEDIPAARYVDLWDFHRGVGGEGPHAYTWSDKPHRLVYDLTGMVAALREQYEGNSLPTNKEKS